MAFFQLKSKSSEIGNRIVDGAFSAMRKTILADLTPNLFLLHYALQRLSVENVFLIPHFAFSLSMLEKRKPLSPTARRAGWVGCNFLLTQIPADARIPIVLDGKACAPAKVRTAYRKIHQLENLKVENRGWTLDVLNIVRALNKKEFSLSDVYAHENELAKLHPNNFHIQPKIRQQLQMLRKMGLLTFLGEGTYRLE